MASFQSLHRTNRALIHVLLVFVVLFSLAGLSSAQSQPSPSLVQGEYIFYASGSTQNLNANIAWALTNEAILDIRESPNSRHYYIASIDENLIRKALPRSEKKNYTDFSCVLLESYIRSLESCDPNYEVQLSSVIPSDPHYSRNWGLDAIRTSRAWETGTGSPSVKVAVIDTGIEYDHPDLKDNILINNAEIPRNGRDDDRNGYVDDYYGINTDRKNGNPRDDNGHGTHVAGIIGAVGNNAIGTSGVNWDVKLLPIKFLDFEGRGYISNSVDGINYAVTRGVDVINASYGSSRHSNTERAAIRHAGLNGVLFVAASGNHGKNIDRSPSYPASYGLSNIISVGATTQTDRLADFSNFGRQSVDIGAPGVEILSTYLNGQYAVLSGTSMATPFVAGSAALVKSFFPAENHLQIKERLMIGEQIPSLLGITKHGARLSLPGAMSGAVPDFGGFKYLEITRFRSRLENGRRDDSKLVRNEKFVLVVKGTPGADVAADLNFKVGSYGETIDLTCQLEEQTMPARGRLVISGELRFNGALTATTTVRADTSSGSTSDYLRRRVLEPIDKFVDFSDREKLQEDLNLACERINRTVRFR